MNEPQSRGVHARYRDFKIIVRLLIIGAGVGTVIAQTPPPKTVLFMDVRIFDGKNLTLWPSSNVLIRGNLIERISVDPIPTDSQTTVIDGGGRTLMPGLIDAHTHLMYTAVSQNLLLFTDVGFVNVVATRSASDMLMRGFTSVRDLGGRSFGLKMGIDQGVIIGPRIWPAGAMISQSGGHADFRFPHELPAPPDYFSYVEQSGGAAIADGADEVLQRVREQLALGASQVKLMAGGGIASSYDPLDVTQYTVPEIQAAVVAAANWGTYVTVHAYTPAAVRQAIEAGVRCIEHGQLADEATVQLMAKKGIWWSLQAFSLDDPSPFPDGSPSRIKELQVIAGTDNAYQLAKKYQIKTAWGTDNLFSAETAHLQNSQLTRLTRWYTPVEVLKMATGDNADLLALSGPRTPYPSKVGVVEEGALADLLLVNGDPTSNIKLIENPTKNFLVIMKDGEIYKNTLRNSRSRIHH